MATFFHGNHFSLQYIIIREIGRLLKPLGVNAF